MIEVIEIKNPVDIKYDAWSNFCTAFDTEGEKNFKYDFGQMTKKYGQAYIEYCRAAWAVNDGVMTEDEFCIMNGGIPRGFFEKKVK